MTLAFIMFFIVALIVYNVLANFNEETGDTISDIIADAVNNEPILIFMIGIVCGHLWWQ